MFSYMDLCRYSVVKELVKGGVDQSQSTKPAAFHEARARFFMAVH